MGEFRGYSTRTLRDIEEADANHPGVILGRLCIAQEIPVADVAQFFKVSRMTIYKWFRGQEMPRKKQVVKIQEIIEKLRNKAG